MMPEIGFSWLCIVLMQPLGTWQYISILIHGHVPVPVAAVCHSVNDEELV